jgi:hypothetical protein
MKLESSQADECVSLQPRFSFMSFIGFMFSC